LRAKQVRFVRSTVLDDHPLARTRTCKLPKAMCPTTAHPDQPVREQLLRLAGLTRGVAIIETHAIAVRPSSIGLCASSTRTANWMAMYQTGGGPI
jgi:hypothetical protein